MTAEDPAAMVNAARALRKQGRFDEALALLDRCLDRDPEYGFAWRHKGETLGQMGRHAESVEAYRWALDLEPDLAKG